MGRMKDLFIDLQNDYGYNLEDLPEGFSMEEYIAAAIKEKEAQEQLFCQQYKSSKQ
jgi:hypothetical protein